MGGHASPRTRSRLESRAGEAREAVFAPKGAGGRAGHHTSTMGPALRRPYRMRGGRHQRSCGNLPPLSTGACYEVSNRTPEVLVQTLVGVSRDQFFVIVRSNTL